MRIPISLILFLSIAVTHLYGQDKRPVVETYADEITTDELKEHVYILASDEYEGRETGLKGQKMAAEYLSKYYNDLGVEPRGEEGTYYQTIPLEQQKWGDVTFESNDDLFTFLEDFYCYGRNTPESKLRDDEVVFVGYGIDDKRYSDYDGVNVRNKIVVALAGEPKDKKGNNLITGTNENSEWVLNWRSKLEAAKANEVKALLLVRKNVKKQVKRFQMFISSPTLQLTSGPRPSRYATTLYISDDVFESLVGKSLNKMKKKSAKAAKKGKHYTKTVSSNVEINLLKDKEPTNGENVLAYIEGTDLKDELLVVTAHYDHVGKKDKLVFNGADDNASGTSCLMEIAESFIKAKEEGNGPRRSILIFHNSGEEKGLLGSKHYVNEPVYPLENTIACINIDMVGRMDPEHEEKEDSNYVYVIGSNFLSSDLHRLNEDASKDYSKLDLDYTFNSLDDPNRYYYRSDHYNFVEKGIPSVFFYKGEHEDYHEATDTADKILYKQMRNVARHIFYLSWQLANRDERIKIDMSMDDLR